MIAFLKRSMIAAVAVLAFTGVAAASTIAPGPGNIDISAGNGYHYQNAFDVGTGSNTLSFNFMAMNNLVLSGAANTLEFTGMFKNLSVMFDGATVMADSASTTTQRSYTLNPLMFAFGDVKSLMISWMKVVKQPGVNKDAASVSLQLNTAVSPVPLPAGGVLLAGALGGIAALRRRKSL